MSRHYCLSSRPDALGRWREAFPDGCVGGDVSQLAGQVGVGDVLWVHAIPASGKRIDDPVKAARQLFPACHVVVMSKVPTQLEALQALNAGANGYCHVLSSSGTFHQIAVVVSHGGLWIGPDLMNRVVHAAGKALSQERHPSYPDTLGQLSSREKAVAVEVARGAANKEIARTLGITERTVKAHLGSIFSKLNIRDRLQLVLVINQTGEPIGNAA